MRTVLEAVQLRSGFSGRVTMHAVAWNRELSVCGETEDPLALRQGLGPTQISLTLPPG